MVKTTDFLRTLLPLGINAADETLTAIIDEEGAYEIGLRATSKFLNH
jgi:hypothetical protein